MNKCTKMLVLLTVFTIVPLFCMEKKKKRTAQQAQLSNIGQEPPSKKRKIDEPHQSSTDNVPKEHIIKALDYKIISSFCDNLTDQKIIRENVSTGSGPWEFFEGRRHETAFTLARHPTDAKIMQVKDRQTHIEYKFTSKMDVACFVEWGNRMVVLGGENGALEFYDLKDIAKAHRYTVSNIHQSVITSLAVLTDGRLVSKSNKKT